MIRKSGNRFFEKDHAHLERNTIREQAMLRPQPAAYPAGQVALYPLSYRRMERRAGFEPATSRLTDEVTDIFTTDREGVGGERAMLLPPLRAPFWRRSNRHLHHRRTEACASAMSRHAGEQAKSVSVIQLPSIPRDGREPWRVRGPLPGAAPRCVTSQAGFEPAFSIGAKYPKSSPPALVWPRDAANRKTKHVCARRVIDAPLLRTAKKGSLCHRYPAHRLVPSDRPRALGRAPLRREPRDPGLPFRPRGRDISNEPCFGK